MAKKPMKVNKLILMGVVIILLLSLSGISAEVQTDTKDKYGSVKTEDSNNVIEIELDITGLNPTKEYAVIEIKNIGKKLSGGLNDIMVISPIPLFNIQIESNKYKTKTIVTNQSYTCSGSSYGYIDTTHFYCNTTYSSINNATLINETYDFQQIINVPAGSIQKTNVVTWSTSEVVTEKEKEVKTVKLKSKSISSSYGYGVFMYYIEAEDFIAGLENSYKIKVTPSNFGLLPIKYTVCIGDNKDIANAFCLDPTITNSRTWTTNADFTNGTILSNMTTSNDQLEISNSLFSKTSSFEGLSGAITCSPVSDPEGQWTYSATGARTGSVDIDNDFGDGGYAAQNEISVCSPNSTFVYNITDALPLNYTVWTARFDTTNGVYGGINIGKNTTHHLSIGIYYHNTNGLNLYNESIIGGVRQGTTFYGYYGLVDQSYRKMEVIINTTCVSVKVFNATSGNPMANWNCASNPTAIFGTDLTNVYMGMSAYGQDVGRLYWDDVLIQKMNFTPQSQLQDRQSWTPQSGNTFINLSAVVVTTGTSTVKFRYNSTNASLDTSLYTTLSTNGTNDLTFNLNANNPIFYEFLLADTSGTETPKVTSFTVNEASTNSAPTTPTVSRPTEAFTYTNSSVIFDYNSTDTEGDDITYYVFVNSLLNTTDTVGQSSTITFAEGYYNMSVIAGDTLLNSSKSIVYNFSVNYAPTIQSARITPTTAYTNNTLIGYCNATDSTPNTLSYNWRWYNNSIQHSIGTSTGGNTQGVEFNAINLTSANTTKGQTWILSCQANDGNSTSSYINSTGQLISNSIPSTPTITQPSSYQNFTSTNVTFLYNSTDIDGDALTYYQYLNGTLNQTISSGQGNTSLNFSADGDYSVFFIAFDSTANSSNSTTVNFTIDTTAPVIISNTSSVVVDMFNVTLNFNENANATFYYSNSSNLTSATSIVSATYSTIHSFQVEPLVVNVNYYYKINGSDPLGNQYSTDIIRFLTTTGTPGGGGYTTGGTGSTGSDSGTGTGTPQQNETQPTGNKTNGTQPQIPISISTDINLSKITDTFSDKLKILNETTIWDGFIDMLGKLGIDKEKVRADITFKNYANPFVLVGFLLVMMALAVTFAEARWQVYLAVSIGYIAVAFLSMFMPVILLGTYILSILSMIGKLFVGVFQQSSKQHEL